MRLASVAKLPVSAAALLGLGPEHQFTTSLVSIDGPIADGSIRTLGSLPVEIPALMNTTAISSQDQIFHWLGTSLASQRPQTHHGDIIIDASYFSGPIRPTTYPGGLKNAQAWYSAPASAFAWNDNCIEVQVRPTTLGQPASVHTRPRSSRITISNKTRTANSKLSKGIIVSRALDANTLLVSGRYAKKTSWFPLAIHQDPDLLAGDHLAALFRDHGIAIDGKVRLGSCPGHCPHFTRTSLLH